MRSEAIPKDAFIVVAVVVFLIFVGFNVYRILNPGRQDIECILKDGAGKVISTERAHPAGDREYQRFMKDAKARGLTCKVFTSERGQIRP